MKINRSVIKGLIISNVVILLLLNQSAYAGITDKLEKLIEKQEYAKAVEEGEKYLSKKPDAPDAQDVRAMVMKADYEITKSTDTLAAYEAFEKKYPNSTFQDDLTERKSKVYYRTVTLPAGTIAAFKDFLGHFPKSSLAPEAKKLLCESAFKESAAQNSYESFSSFRTTYADCPQAAEALNREMDFAFKNADRLGTREAYIEFINKYAGVESAKNHVNLFCESEWNRVDQLMKADEYMRFAKDFVKCAQAQNVQKKIREMISQDVNNLSPAKTTLYGYQQWVTSLAFSPNGEILISGGWDQSRNTARVWDLTQGREIFTLNTSAFFVFSAAFASDGKTIVLGGCKEGRVDANLNQLYCANNGTVEVWNIETHAKVVEFAGHNQTVYAVAFSPDSSKIVSAGGDGLVKIWDVSTGKLLRTLKGHSSWALSVSFSPDGRFVASGSDDKTVRIWNVETGEAVAVLRKHLSRVWALAYSPDGKILASGGDDQMINIWAMPGGTVIKTLSCDTSSLAFNKAGSLMVAGSWDSSIRVYDTSDWTEIKKLTGHSAKIRAVAFSPTTVALASASEDNTIKLWGDISPIGFFPWTPITSTSAPITDIVEVTERPGNLFMATAKEGIWKSTDGGNHWVPTVYSQGNVKRVFVTGDTIWGVVADQGFIYSNNSGNTWNTAVAPEPGLEYISAEVKGAIIYAGTNRGLFSSKDGGKSWQILTDKDKVIKWIDANEKSPDNIRMVSASGELRLSNNGGKDWTTVLSDKSITRAFTVPEAPNAIFVARAGGAMLRSKDSGAHWEPVRGVQGEVKWVKGIKGSQNKLMLLTDNGLYQSKDAGDRWEFIRSSEGQRLQGFAVLTGGKVILTSENAVKMSTTINAIQSLSDINFKFGSAELTPEAKVSLAQIIEILKKNQQLKIRIEGYTDNVGNDETNFALSRKRAQSVMNFLVQSGIQATRFEIIGYGKQYPVSTNDTDEGRAKNRRVVISLN